VRACFLRIAGLQRGDIDGSDYPNTRIHSGVLRMPRRPSCLDSSFERGIEEGVVLPRVPHLKMGARIMGVFYIASAEVGR